MQTTGTAGGYDYVLWCASEYSVAGRISCHVPYDSTRTNVCQWLFAEIFSLTAAVSNRIDSIRNLFIIFALDFPALENPISEKNELLYSAILPFVPCLILIFKPIRIILVEIFRVVVFVAQTVRAVVRATSLVLKWGAWFVLRLMIDRSFQRHIVPVFQISLLRGQNLLVFCGCHKYRIEIVTIADLPHKRIANLPGTHFVRHFAGPA